MASHDISLDSKLAFLRQPGSYPETTYRVEAIETHMSWVFLTKDFAYKLKKPVRYDFLDFSTPAARRFYCEEEVRLNRRLAADVYLGVVALGIDASGHLQLDGSDAIDWLVKMRRLPTRHMLDYLIRHGDAGTREIIAVADTLTSFYARCTSIAITHEEYRQGFMRLVDNNLTELSDPVFQLPKEEITAVCKAQQNFLQEKSNLLNERIRAGRIVEGHGDLRPEHICLQPSVAIIDCLEFSRDLRIVDVIDELAFLALECERLGAPDSGALILQRYVENSGDAPSAALIHFYQSVRAALRAKIAIRHLNEEKYRYSASWRQRALDYLQLARRHAIAC